MKTLHKGKQGLKDLNKIVKVGEFLFFFAEESFSKFGSDFFLLTGYKIPVFWQNTKLPQDILGIAANLYLVRDINSPIYFHQSTNLF